MMRFVAALVFAGISCQPAWAANSTAVKWHSPDKTALRILNKLLPDEMQQPDGWPTEHGPEIAWVSIAADEPKYLFAMLPWACGVNCPIYGFRKTPLGWRKVYEVGGGDGIEVLNSKVRGHRDLRQYEEDSAANGTILTSHWDGTQYGNPDRKPYP